MTNTQSVYIDEFNAIVSRDVSVMKASKGLVRFLHAPIVIFRHERKNQRAVAAVRNAMSSCVENCVDGTCLSDLYSRVKDIRDDYIEIVDIIEKLPMPDFLKRPARYNLADWDDLAEDCLIGGNKDIRKSISEIAAIL